MHSTRHQAARTRATPRLLAIAAGLATTLSFISVAPAEEKNTLEQVPPVINGPNSVVFSARALGSGPISGAVGTDEMAERLKDPVKRAALRVERHEQVKAQNADITEVVPLEPEMEAKLIDLLTDQQIANLDVFYASRLDPTGRTNDGFMDKHIAAERQAKEQIRALLGDDRFGLYLDYTSSQGERQQANYFNDRLDAGSKLTPDQKARLMVVLRNHLEQDHTLRMGERRQMLPTRLRSFGPDSADALLKLNITANEENFRRMVTSSRLLLEKVSTVLTPAQLAAYELMETEKLASQRRYVQQMRVSANMPAAFDETNAPEAAAPRVRVPGKVRVELLVAVDGGTPINANLVTDNGTPAVEFEAAKGLWVTATPTLYEDGWFYVDFSYSEEFNGRRLAIRGGGGMGRPSQPEMPLRTHPGGNMVSGSKAYAISADARVTSVQ